MKKIVFILVCFAFCLSSTFAQKFEIAPTRMDYNLEPGQSGRMILHVTNQSDKKRSYITILNDWNITDRKSVV